VTIEALGEGARSSLAQGRYRHFKGGEYEVLGIARDSESMRELVVYRALYGERGLWVRPLEMFTEIVERDGRRMPRFQYVGAI
jgi:cyclomaltodextrinase